jgi:hypothetical protein
MTGGSISARDLDRLTSLIGRATVVTPLELVPQESLRSHLEGRFALLDWCWHLERTSLRPSDQREWTSGLNVCSTTKELPRKCLGSSPEISRQSSQLLLVRPIARQLISSRRAKSSPSAHWQAKWVQPQMWKDSSLVPARQGCSDHVFSLCASGDTSPKPPRTWRNDASSGKTPSLMEKVEDSNWLNGGTSR